MSETEVVADLLTARPVGEVGAVRSAQGAVEKNAVVCGEVLPAASSALIPMV